MPRDPIEHELDVWAEEAASAPPPPPDFLRLVRRERVLRHVRGLAVAAGLTLVATVLVAVLVGPPPVLSPVTERNVASAEPTVGYLHRLNVDSPAAVVLPESPASGIVAYRLGDRARPELVDELARGL